MLGRTRFSPRRPCLHDPSLPASLNALSHQDESQASRIAPFGANLALVMYKRNDTGAAAG